jgi:DNA-binding NtrC family response regulator
MNNMEGDITAMKTNNNHNGSVLVVDDEPSAIKVLSAILSEDGYDVYKALNVDGATRVIHKENVDAVITDLKMPGKDGMEFFGYITENYPDIPVIFLTAYGTVESAVSAMTDGAFYYFIKPPDYMKLKSILARAVEQRRLRREVESLKKRLLDENHRYRIIGNTSAMRKILDTVEAVRDSACSVLITGETGTGKELIARALHYGSNRKDKPFVTVNCAAIPRELMESELFGYEKGAFTNAISRRTGKFEEAAGGVVFLDEIGELDPSLQAKLLRVLQEREIERLGSNQKIKVDFRLICSTNRSLKSEIQNGNCREDLFYRVNVVGIHVPPLRERKNDIPLLISEFVNEFCIREGKRLGVSDVLTRGDTINLKDLREEFPLTGISVSTGNSTQTLKVMEMQAVKDSLKACNGNKSRAAKMLGISRKALYKRLKECQI